MRSGTIEPVLRGGISTEIGVPERSAQSQNHPVVVGVALLSIAGQRTIGEGGVLGSIENQFIFMAGRQGGKDSEAGGEVSSANGRIVPGAGHEHPGNGDFTKGVFRLADLRAAGTEHDGGFDARVRGAGIAAREMLAADGLSCHRTKGMAGHTDMLESEAAMQGGGVVGIPALELIEDVVDILDAKEKVFEVGGAT